MTTATMSTSAAQRRAPGLLLVLVCLALGVVHAPAAVAEPSVTVPVIHVEGRGHGHGVGMSQWGAFTMAQQGASAAEIVGSFYPGTQLAQQGGEVVVGIDRRARVRLQLPGGGEIRSARGGEQHPGFPVAVAPGGAVEVVRESGGYRVIGAGVTPLDTSNRVRYSPAQECFLVLCSPADEPPPDTDPPPSAQPPPSSPPPSSPPERSPGRGPAPPPSEAGHDDPVSPSPVWAVPADGNVVRSVDRGRSYRGLFEVTGDPGAVRVRNHVDVEQYLKGMAEVPGNWPAAAVQAQAIAARTFALRAMATRGELCDTESCQVYAGTAHESPGQSAAVDATRHTVVTHGGALASTFYSASGGGFSATAAEGFGTAGNIPYLPARQYPTVRPDEWSTDIALADVAHRFGYRGTLHTVTIDEVGPSGRAVAMALRGDGGTVGVEPQDFRRRLGLRSTLFTIVTTETAEAPMPPPPQADPGVVGADAEVEDAEIAISEIRRPRRDLPIGRATARPIEDGRGVPMAAASAAFVLLVGAWTALTLRAMALAPVRGIRLAGWTNRFR